MKRRLGIAVLCCIIAAAMLLTACTGGSKTAGGDSGKDNLSKIVNGKYDPPITLTACRFLGPQVKYADGESLENNIWTRAYESDLGIKIKYTFTSPDFQTFDTKVNMAIASDSLPDIMPIYSTLFFRAVDGGRCQDLTEVYNTYASKEVKDIMNRFGSIAYKSASKNGKLYALANPPTPDLGGDMLWIRTDWLKKLNLQPPKNMDDVVNIAKAFTNNDPDGDKENDTFGLALNKDLGGFGGFANGYHAYKGIWIDKNGKLESSDIQPEMKTALGKFAELYKAGCIDEEFVLKSDEDLKADYGNETLGMVFAGSAAPDGAINQSVKTNPNATWEAFNLPSCDDKPALSGTGSRVGNFVAVNTKCKYPESVVKLANFALTKINDVSPAARAFHDKDGIDTFWYPVVVIGGTADQYYNIESHNKIVKALDNGDTSSLNGEQLGYYTRIKTWTDNKNPEGWGMWKIFGPNSSLDRQVEVGEKKLYYADKFWGPETPTWKEKGPNLAYKTTEYFSYIIIGDQPLSYFDEWVKYFNVNGGKKATEEINAWYQKEGKLKVD